MRRSTAGRRRGARGASEPLAPGVALAAPAARSVTGHRRMVPAGCPAMEQTTPRQVPRRLRRSPGRRPPSTETTALWRARERLPQRGMPRPESPWFEVRRRVRALAWLVRHDLRDDQKPAARFVAPESSRKRLPSSHGGLPDRTTLNAGMTTMSLAYPERIPKARLEAPTQQSSTTPYSTCAHGKRSRGQLPHRGSRPHGRRALRPSRRGYSSARFRQTTPPGATALNTITLIRAKAMDECLAGC